MGHGPFVLDNLYRYKTVDISQCISLKVYISLNHIKSDIKPILIFENPGEFMNIRDDLKRFLPEIGIYKY